MAGRPREVQSVNTQLQKGRKSTQRERLLAGMIAVANRDGYAGANVSAVIAQAGVSRPTFYDYFADRDDCFLAAFAHAHDCLLAAVEEAVDAPETQLVARAAIGALVGFASARPAMARFVMSEVLAGGPSALAARDAGIDELAELIEGAERQSPNAPAPDLPPGTMIGAVERVLGARLRRGLADREGLREGMLGWLSSYERAVSAHRRRVLTVPQRAKRHVAGPDTQLRAPAALGPGRPRQSPAEVAENHRQRLLFAAARLAGEHGYTATTIAQVTERAGLDRRAFYAIFTDKRELFMAVHEFGFQRLLAVTGGAFFAGASWPARVWEGLYGLCEFLQSNPTIAHVGFVEAHAVGPGAVQRLEDSVSAFTVFLQEGYRHEPKVDTPSSLALEAIVLALFESVYRQAREQAQPQLVGLAPTMVFIALAPFLGAAGADQAIDAELKTGGSPEAA
jgi:AcrR family transcriptional regulator